MKSLSPSSSSVRLLCIAEEYQGQRLDNFLFTYLKGVPKSFIYRVIRKGEVRVNKKRIKPEYKLNAKDILRIPPLTLSLQVEKPIITKGYHAQSLLNSIIYEDNEIIVLNKPSGIAVHGGSGLAFGAIEMLRVLRPKEPYLELVHRLDKETSGILLLAKKRAALRTLHQQLRNDLMKKKYLALVKGHWPTSKKVVTEPLLKQTLQSGERRVKISQSGKFAETRFMIEKKYTHCTLLKVIPVTGRTHQIRVHTQSQGHPIAGDLRYTDNEFNVCMQQQGLNRLFLHASELQFVHPKTAEIVQFKAELSEELQNFLFNLT